MRYIKSEYGQDPVTWAPYIDITVRLPMQPMDVTMTEEEIIHVLGTEFLRVLKGENK